MKQELDAAVQALVASHGWDAVESAVRGAMPKQRPFDALSEEGQQEVLENEREMGDKHFWIDWSRTLSQADLEGAYPWLFGLEEDE